jgi:hypothetical protein
MSAVQFDPDGEPVEYGTAAMPTPEEIKAECEKIKAGWGFPTKKGTWLAFAGVPRDAIEIPLRLDNGQRHKAVWNRQSKNQRSATTQAFAEWLVSAARLAV